MRTYRDHYFPTTEELAPDEMRVVALGTGRPFVRPAQANAGWLVELGNGDRFMFDFGFGTQRNFAALEIPYERVTAFFATHLHTDHVGDFPQIWIGSWVGGRLHPLEVYGPSGPLPKYGMRHFVEKTQEAYAWDTDTRVGFLPAVGARINVHEFSHEGVNVVYEKNGVKITAFPAVHIYDGPVSFRLDWNGRSFVYSGDTTPSRYMVENGKGADIVVHDTYNTVEQLVAKSGYDPKQARGISGYVHSLPHEAGKVFDLIQPRLAVGFHFFNDFDTAPEMANEIRKYYAGPLALAQDLMVFNVMPERIVTRMAVAAQHVWPSRPDKGEGFQKAVRENRLSLSEELRAAQLFPK